MRSHGTVVSYKPDTKNLLPVLVEVTWAYDGGVDISANAGNKPVFNYFLMDDAGKVAMNSEFFKNIPANAKNVNIVIYRGNATVDSQDLFVLAYSSAGFSIDLVD